MRNTSKKYMELNQFAVSTAELKKSNLLCQSEPWKLYLNFKNRVLTSLSS